MIPLALSTTAATAWADDWVISTAACLICGMLIGRAGVFRSDARAFSGKGESDDLAQLG